MPTSLADHLRALSDDELTALIRLRPDLVVPPPADLSALAHRAQSRVSLARALDGLDRFTLEVLDALRYTPAGAGDPRPAGGRPPGRRRHRRRPGRGRRSRRRRVPGALAGRPAPARADLARRRRAAGRGGPAAAPRVGPARRAAPRPAAA